MENLDYISILFIAFSLSADCFAVSVSGGIAMVSVTRTQILRTAFSFGFFQALMVWAGWLLGQTVIDVVSDYDHWLAFALLLIVGSKMIWESFHTKEKQKIDISRGLLLITLSIATSIDALAVGLSLAFTQVNINLASATIGLVAFFITLAGFIIGRRVGGIVGRRAELVGGLVLIAIGIRIVADHLLNTI